MDINDKLILERDIKQLSQEFSSLTDKMDRLKREQVDLLDLNKKEKNRLEALQKEIVSTNKEIADAKLIWISEKRKEETDLKQSKLETLKILNRENFTKLEEQKIIKIMAELDERKASLDKEESKRAEKESAIKLKEIVFEKQEKVLLDRTKEFEENIKLVKEKMLVEINNW